MPMIRGTAKWCKLINPTPTYDKTDKEWTFDLVLDTAAKKTLAGLGVAAQIKTNKEGEDVIKFSRRVTKRNPTNPDGPRVPATPIRIVDKAGQPWDGKTLIGNGSTLNVQFAVNDKAMGGKRASILAVQVWDLVEYEGRGDYEEFPVDDSGVESWT